MPEYVLPALAYASDSWLLARLHKQTHTINRILKWQRGEFEPPPLFFQPTAHVRSSEIVCPLLFGDIKSKRKTFLSRLLFINVPDIDVPMDMDELGFLWPG